MKKIILVALIGILFGGCYTQIGTLKEDEGYSTSGSGKGYSYYYENNYDTWYYSKYVYRYYLPYPRYSLFFRYYTPGFAIGWGEWWYYDPYWFDYYWWDWYWWDRYYWYSYWYLPMGYYYPWWYRSPVIVVINNYPYYSGGSREVIIKPRNFGLTRSGIYDERVNTTSGTVSPPSRNTPSGQTSGSLQSTSNEGSFKKRSGSEREAPSVERNRSNERTRETGSVRTPSTPRVVPRSNDGNSGAPNQDSAPPRRTEQPRKTGTNRNSIQIYRNYDTGRSTLIELPRHNSQSENITSNPSPQFQFNNNQTQPEQNQSRQRHLGNRR